MHALHKCISAVRDLWEWYQLRSVTNHKIIARAPETHAESIKYPSLFFSKHKTKKGFSGKQGECLVTNTSFVSLFFNYSITINNCNIEILC